MSNIITWLKQLQDEYGWQATAVGLTLVVFLFIVASLALGVDASALAGWLERW